MGSDRRDLGSLSVARLREVIHERPLLKVLLGSTDAIVFVSAGRVVLANPAFVRIVGAEQESSILEKAIEDWVMPEDVPTWDDAISEDGRIESGASIRMVRAGGSRALVEIQQVEWLEAKGQTIIAVVLRDVTVPRHAHARMLLQDRMTSIGTVAAGVAHEINNPLSYIIGNLTFLEEEVATLSGLVPPENLEHVSQAMREARQGAERVRQIVKDLQTFARADHQDSRSTDVRRTIELALNMAWSEIRHRGRLQKVFAEVPLVSASEARLGQVFLSLLLNAAHALPEGGADRSFIRVETRADEDRVIVEITNSGPGIRPDVAKRIFDPFATFGAVGVGSGLGLSIAHSLVQDIGGEIVVETSPLLGTTFRVSLPAVREGREPQPSISSSLSMTALAAPGPIRLLLIDDEPLMVTALRRALGDGHEITSVPCGRNAIEELSRDRTYELIICDLMMPDMTGMDVHDWLEAQHPGLEQRMVFITGGSFEPSAQAFLARVPNPRFEKPIDLGKLRALVKRRTGR